MTDDTKAGECKPKPLNEDMDAKRWTDEFLCQIAKTPDMATDFGSMVGWFANAIMAGSDVTRWKMEKQIAALQAEVAQGKMFYENLKQAADDALAAVTREKELIADELYIKTGRRMGRERP